MAAPEALGRRQPRQAGPAETADSSGFVVRQQLVARDADAREQEIQCPG